MRRTFFLIALFAGMLAGATAWSQACGQSEDVYRSLEDKYGESRIMSGANPDMRSVTEIWANPAEGTWTQLRTTASGLSCVISSGEGAILWTPHPAGESL